MASAKERGYMPAVVFWQTASITFLILAVVMLLVFLIDHDYRSDAWKAESAYLRFRYDFFLAIAGKEAQDEHRISDQNRAVAAYLKAHDLDEVIRREKFARDWVSEPQRAQLVITHPEKFPPELFLLTLSPEWEKLRGNPKDLALLKQLLLGEGAVPDLVLDARPGITILGLWLWLLIPQFGSMLMFALRWLAGRDSQNKDWRKTYRWHETYRWHDMWWPNWIGFVLLLPGGAPILMLLLCGSVIGGAVQGVRCVIGKRNSLEGIPAAGGEGSGGRELLQLMQSKYGISK